MPCSARDANNTGKFSLVIENVDSQQETQLYYLAVLSALLSAALK